MMKKNNFSKKAEGNLVYQKIIVLILVLLVVLVVMVAFFRADVLSWMKDRLPSYRAPPDNETTITDDQIKLLGYEKIAKVDYIEKPGDSLSHYYLTFYKDYIKNRNEIISAPIIINWNSEGRSSGNIEIAQFFGEKMGSMEDSRIKIDITEADYNKLKLELKNLPDFSIFIKLNDAKYIGGGIYKTK